MYGYKSEKDLYDNLVPALKVKKRLLDKSGYDNISIEDIWNYLKESRWSKAIGLELADMVSDIVHVNNLDLVKYKESNNKLI